LKAKSKTVVQNRYTNANPKNVLKWTNIKYTLNEENR